MRYIRGKIDTSWILEKLSYSLPIYLNIYGVKLCCVPHTLSTVYHLQLFRIGFSLRSHQKGYKCYHPRSERLKDQLSSEFEMKGIGNLKYFLGIEVARNEDCIMLRQRKYVLDLLAETGMLDCTPVDTPIEQNHQIAEYPDQVLTDKS
ncbi:hypothetical protein ACLB2K_059989 [Fragaria x ananassa]